MTNTYKKRVNNIAYGIDFVPRHIAKGLNKVVEAPYHLGNYVSKYYTSNKNTSHKDNGTNNVKISAHKLYLKFKHNENSPESDNGNDITRQAYHSTRSRKRTRRYKNHMFSS